MPKLSIVAGATSQTVNVFIRDSSSTTGAGLTALVFNTASLTAYYALPKAASVAITLATLAAVTTAYSSGGFKEIDATNMPGWYRFDIPDAALASGRFVSIHLKGATNMAPLPLEIELTAVNNQSATAFITGVNSIAPPSNWNLMSVDASGRVDVIKIAGTTQTARDIGASVLLSTGTGTGQLDFTSGVVKGNVTQLLGTAWLTPSVAGTPDVNAKQHGGTAQTGRDIGLSVLLSSGTGTGQVTLTGGAVTNVINLVNSPGDSSGVTTLVARGDAYTRLGAPAGASVSVDIAAINTKTTNLPAAPAATGDIPTANANADALLDRTAGVETSWTLRQAMRIILSALTGKLSGAATTTVAIRDVGDTKARITATVDADGNRSAVSWDKT